MTDTSVLDPARLAPDPANPPVAEVMRPEVVFCLPSTPADAIAKLLADNALAEIPVLIDRRPVGYVAGSDVVARLVDGDIAVAGSDRVRPPATDVLARDLLRTPPLLVDEHTPVNDVVDLMRQSGRLVALVMHEDERPVGLLSITEVAAHAAARLAEVATGA